MSTRYEIKAWRKSRNDKAYTVRIGSAWTDDKGVIRMDFDASPIADDKGRVTAFLEVPREREEAPPRKGLAARGDDSEIPF